MTIYCSIIKKVQEQHQFDLRQVRGAGAVPLKLQLRGIAIAQLGQLGNSWGTVGVCGWFLGSWLFGILGVTIRKKPYFRLVKYSNFPIPQVIGWLGYLVSKSCRLLADRHPRFFWNLAPFAQRGPSIWKSARSWWRSWQPCFAWCLGEWVSGSPDQSWESWANDF